MKGKIASVSCAVAVVLGGGYLTAYSADTSRNLKWLYPAEASDFATAANWAWVDSTESGEITTPPGVDDTARFSGMNPIGDPRVLTLNADTTVSNFIYEVDNGPATTVDLGNHTLTISNNFSIKNGVGGIRSYPLTFKNGAIDVPGSTVGTTSYGQPREDYSGFFMNRLQNNGAGVNLVFDNVSLVVTNAPKNVMLQAKFTSGATSRLCLTNGATWLSSGFQIISMENNNGTTSPSPVEMLVSGEGTSLTVKNGIGLEPKSLLTLTFQDGASLDAKGINSTPAYQASTNAFITFNGGTHKLGDALASGDNGSLTLSKTEFVVTNKAEIAATGRISFRCSSLFKVCDGAKVTTTVDVQVGHHAWCRDYYWGTSTLLLDGGAISASSFGFGQMAIYSNNCLRVVGPLSYLESKYAIGFNYGTKVAFEIPADGYCDENGDVRVPVVSVYDSFNMNTTDTSDPISLELKTKAFDKRNPKASITLMKAAKSSAAVLRALADNVTFVDSARNPGTVSVSADGTSLVYTAPTPTGMAIIVR